MQSHHRPSSSVPLWWPLVLVLAVLVTCALTAIFRYALGAAPRAGFWPVFAVLPMVLMRLAQASTPVAALSGAGGVLLLSGVWHFLAKLGGRRAPDALLCSLLALQAFFLARVAAATLPAAAPFTLSLLSFPQKLNLFLQVITIFALLAQWTLQPAMSQWAGRSLAASAPSRVTGFLQRRRRPWWVAGALLIALAFAATVYSGSAVFHDGTAPGRSLLLLVSLWLVLDGIYFVGRDCWQRLP